MPDLIGSLLFLAFVHPGLGTSTSQEAKEYFSDMQRHRIPFKYAGPEDDEAITLVRFYPSVWLIALPWCKSITGYIKFSQTFWVGYNQYLGIFISDSCIFLCFAQAFSKKKVEERKVWLTNFMINRRQRREHNLPEVTSQQLVNYVHSFFPFFSWFLLGFTASFTVSSSGLPVWSGHQVPLLQRLCQQGAGTFLQL